MPCSCHGAEISEKGYSSTFRKALWFALFVNLAMFLIEMLGGAEARSVSLWADALDFAGDSANYAISLFVLPLAVAWRSRTAMAKGLTMTVFGLVVLLKTIWSVVQGQLPEPTTMTVIGFLALTANVGVALILYRYRSGDANMRSVWLCSRNDAIGNLAVIGAATGVAFSGSIWPDIIVAFVMAPLAIHSGLSIVAHARSELRVALSN